jgi:hypothetical protein
MYAFWSSDITGRYVGFLINIWGSLHSRKHTLATSSGGKMTARRGEARSRTRVPQLRLVSRTPMSRSSGPRLEVLCQWHFRLLTSLVLPRTNCRDLDLGHLLSLARYAVLHVIGRHLCRAPRQSSASRRRTRHASPLCQSSDACSNRLLTRVYKEISSETTGRPSHSHLCTSKHSQPWASSLSSGSFARNG